MDAVLRGAVIYLTLFVLMRASGKRTFAQITPFDFVLLLIVGEATQQGLLGNDFSITNAILVVATLIALDALVAGLQQRWPVFAKLVEGAPLVLVDRGHPIPRRMRRARVSELDVLEQARLSQGLESIGGIKYAVLERSGHISIVPWQDDGPAA